jgi:DNA-binding transcriptional LysR family regulator
VLVFIVSPGTASSVTTSAKLIDFEDTLFVASPAGTSTRRLLDARLGSVGLDAKLAVASAQRDAILPLVLAGAGAALVPESIALVAQHLGAVVARPDPPAVRELALVASGRHPLPCSRSVRWAGRARTEPCNFVRWPSARR